MFGFAPSTVAPILVRSSTFRPTRPIASAFRAASAAVVAFVVAFVAVPTARATNFYWTDFNGDDNWASITGLGTTNWSFTQGSISDTNSLPGVNDDVNIFAFSAPDFNMQLGQNFSIKGLTFLAGSSTSPNPNASLDGAGTFSLTLGSDGLFVGSNTGTVTISANVVLGASETWNNFSSNPLTITGVVSGATGNNLTTGGTGNTILSSANTYQGSTSVFTGTLTVSGNGSILNTSGISLGAGTMLTLDNTTTNIANRIADNTTITSKGGIITLNGNAVGTTETVGTLGVAVGASVVAVNGTGSSLVFGASGGSPIPSLNRTIGGTVNFVPGVGANINLPNAPTPNGILGGWAVTGTAAGNNLNWATLDGSNNVIPYSAYTPLTSDPSTGVITSGMTGTAQQNNNIQYNATTNASSPLITASTTINTLYMTGGSQPIPTANIPNQNAGGTQNSNTISFWNGITFGNGNGSQSNSQVPGTAVTLTIGAGGIISSGATGIGHYNNKSDIPNMAFIGYLFGEYNTTNTGGTTTDIGQITVPDGVPDLSVYTASDGNLRIASLIVDRPVTITGTTTANLTNNSNIVTLTGTATTAQLVVGESVRNLNGLVNGVQVITGITDATHFTIGANANATSTGGTAVFGTSIGLTKSGPGLLDLGNGNTQTNKPNTLITGKVTINEGILLINAAGQLGTSLAAPDTLTFNGGGLRTYAGLTTTTAQGWTVGTRGGSFAYSGGGTSTLNNKITGVGGFTWYSRGIGGGNGMTIVLNNNLAAGGGGNNDYQGTTSFLENPAQGGQGDTANNWGSIQWGQNNQVPANSAVVMNVVAQDDTFTVQPNNSNYVGGITTGSIPAGGGVSVNINGLSDHFGSLAGQMNIRNFNASSTLTLGGNNLSTTYDGSIYGAVTRTNGVDTTVNNGAGTLNKVGTGTQTITGSLRFTGNTNINGGTLRLTNTGALNISPVNVNGSGTLAGGGVVTAPVVVNAGGALAPSNFSGTTVTTLTVNGNLTMTGGSALNFLVGAPSGTPFASFGTADLVSVTGTGNVALNNVTTKISVNLNPIANSGFGPGIYDLLDSSTSSGTFTTASNTNFLLPPNGSLVYKIAPPGASVANINGGGSIYTNSTTNELVLVVQNNPNPPVIWTGAAGDSQWNTTQIDWATDPAHAPTKYTDGASVTFDQTGTHTNISLGGATFKPSGITFNNSPAVPYTFSNGTLADGTNGPTGVTKSQGGAVTFNNNNTFTGKTTITGGSITIGATGTYASPLIIVNGTGASFNVLAGGTLTGTSSLNLSNTGAATFSNASQSLASLSGDVTSTLTLNGTALTLTTGVSGDNGAINGAGSITVNGATADVTLSGNNSYGGGTTVPNGILRAGSLTAFGTNPSVVVSGTGTLDINGTSLNGSIYNVSVGGAGVGGNGAIVNDGADQGNALANTIAMTADTTFGGTGRWDIRPVGAGTAIVTGNGHDLTKTGANTVGLATTSAQVNGVKNININQGTLVVADTSTVDNTVPGSIFLNPTGTLSVGNYASLTGVVINKPFVMNGGTLQTDSTGTNGNATLTTGITLNAVGNVVAQTGSTLALNGAITNGTSSTSGVSYSGGGTVSLGVTSNYGGPTTAAGVTLLNAAGVDNVLPTATDLTLNGAVLDLNGHSQQLNSLSGASTITSGAAGNVTLTINGAAPDTQYAGVISNGSGTLALVKSGASNQTISGQNTYSGGTTVNGPGTLSVGGTGSLALFNPMGTGQVTLAGGTLALKGQFAPAVGLTADLYDRNPTGPNGGNFVGPDPDFASLSAMTAHFASIAPATVSVPTSTNGKSNLDFSNTAYGNAAPFAGPNAATTADYGFVNATNYEAHFSGFINVTTPGTYTFSTTSDDGSMLFIDGKNTPVVNNNNFQGATTVSGTVNFTTTGYHQIDVGFFQGGGGNGLLVAYTPPGGISTTIPNSILASAGSTFAGTQTYGNNFVVTSNTTIDVSNSLSAVIGPVSIGANTLALTGTTGASLATGPVTLTGNATFDQAAGTTFAPGQIGETAGPRSITKTGLGTLLLASASNYTGSTTVSAGELRVTNAAGSATGSGTTTIASAATLTGTGHAGAVILNGHLSPGVGTNGIGTIGMGATTFAAASNLDLDVSPLSNDLANTGALTLGGNVNVNLNLLSGFTVGTYTLVSSTGITGAPTFTVTHTGPGDNPAFNSLYNVSKVGNNIVLTVNGTSLTWNGAASSHWNTTDHTWVGGGTYSNSNQVVFDETGSARPNVDIPADVSPLAVKFANNATTYTITGPGAIAGGGVVTIAGPGTVNLNSSNTYTGGTNLLGGTLNLGDPAGNPIGSGVLTIAGGTIDNTSGSSLSLSNSGEIWAGSFTFTNSKGLETSNQPITLTATPTVTVGAGLGGTFFSILGPIGDNGNGFGFTKDGPGTMFLENQGNSYSGTTTVLNGTLLLGAAVPLGNGSAPLTVLGGTLDMGNPSNPISVGAVHYTAGVIQNGTLSATSYLIDNPNPLTLSSTLILAGSGALTKTGAGTLTMTGSNSNTYTGGTIVQNGGVLEIVADNNLGNGGGITLDGGTLRALAGMTIGAGRGITIGPSNGTLNLATIANGTISPAANTGVTYSGQITGPGGLTITGGDGSVANDPNAAPYLFVVNGLNNNYAGPTTINNATVANDVSATGGSFLPTTTVLTIINHGTYSYWGTNTNINNSRSIQVLAGLVGDSTSSIGTENNTTATDLVINTAAATSYTFNGVIEDVAVLGRGDGGDSAANPVTFPAGTGIGGGTITLTKDGAGEEVLGGANLHTGGTIVVNGTLTVNGPNGSLGSGGLSVGTASTTTPATANINNTLSVASLSVAPAAGGSAVVNVTSGNTLTVSGATSVQGTLNKTSGGTLAINGSSSLATGSGLAIAGGTMRINATGASIVGSGVTATVASSATLELDGTTSALASGANRVNIANSGNLNVGNTVVTPTTVQQVGGIDGTGTTTVAASASLTANHIVQTALVIGGIDATHTGLVTIGASDASGNPLASSGALAVAGSLAASDPFGSGAGGSTSLAAAGNASSGTGTSLGGAALGGGSSSAVPEPSSLALVVLAALAGFGLRFRRRRRSIR